MIFTHYTQACIQIRVIVNYYIRLQLLVPFLKIFIWLCRLNLWHAGSFIMEC